MIFLLIMSVLGEASAGMRWAGTWPREWPVRELRRWPLVAAQGVAASGIVRFVVLGIGSGSWPPNRLCQR